MIRVMIERHIADSLAEHYDKAARDTLQLAMQAHGFISGEALQNTDDPNHRLVIATYRTVQDWQRWHRSPERLEMMAAINPMLESEEKVTLFEH
ncbi:antibiotic biosynthesis monooxygenase family protein [Neptuniibacter halophilus]|uniref:antibiotic biosynthesis monooxygenase family protein n=1 Tax=Neptuniibacter halophilus TaxID=651666 RepID=UPI002572537A|nr:antibiotic biosynthesis monooxygenase [Neptuniibacter halophilus]